MTDTNPLGQPVGFPVPGWTTRPWPPARTVAGRWCRLEPLDPARHADDLFRANSQDVAGRMWTYLPYGPFDDAGSFRTWLDGVNGWEDSLSFAIVAGDHGGAVGMAAFLRIDPPNGSIEVGNVAFSPELQGTTAATEAMFLMMTMVFDELGYRRYEWKCDTLNAPSRRAASRFGFVYEGTFRQSWVVRGRSRDTAWFSITDGEWPRLRAAYERWLAPDNFDDDGRQRVTLSEFTRPISEQQGASRTP
jgi:RimJ/RimL family protein N-acetyltransferase